MATLTVEFPNLSELPKELRGDPNEARYLLVGTMLGQGRISKVQACELTGDTPQDLDEKLARYGFHEMGTAKTASSSRWKAVARRLSEEAFLDGRSDEVRQLLDESRITF